MYKKADYDVRIAMYQTAKGDAVCIRFRESLEELVGSGKSDRIKVMRDGDRLYFVAKDGNQCGRGDGTACVANSKLQYSRDEQVQICKPFVGEYSLEYDSKHKSYYVDLKARRTLGIIGKSKANEVHNYGKRAVVKRPLGKLGKTVETVAVTEEKSGNAFFDNMDMRSQQKAEILRLLDILDVDETQGYARAVVRLIKEKINATY